MDEKRLRRTLIVTQIVAGLALALAAFEGVLLLRTRSRLRELDHAHAEFMERGWIPFMRDMKAASNRAKAAREKASPRVSGSAELFSAVGVPAAGLLGPIADELVSGLLKPSAPAAPRAWLGIRFPSVLGKGIPKIVHVLPGSPAEKAGLYAGDTILSMGGRRTKSGASVIKLLSHYHRPGETVTVRVDRAGETKEFRITLAEAPSRRR